MQESERKSFTDIKSFAYRMSRFKYPPQFVPIVEDIDKMVEGLATKLEGGAHISAPSVLKGIEDVQSYIGGIQSKNSTLLASMGRAAIHQMGIDIQGKTENLSDTELAVSRHSFLVTTHSCFKKSCDDLKDIWFKNYHSYSSSDNGVYPIIDDNGNMKKIKEVEVEAEDPSGRSEMESLVKEVRPFISASAKVREKAYSGLSRETFRKEDVQSAGEESMIGDNKLIFKRTYDDECMGIYGGQWLRIGIKIDPKKNAELYAEISRDWLEEGFKLDKKAYLYVDEMQRYALYQERVRKNDKSFLCRPKTHKTHIELQKSCEKVLPVGPILNDRYSLVIHNRNNIKPEFKIFGKNCTRFMNTKFDDDEQGLPYRQSKGGYNVRPLRLKITFEDGTKSYLLTYWGHGKAGEELRWPYDFRDKFVQAHFRGGKPYLAQPFVVPDARALALASVDVSATMPQGTLASSDMLQPGDSGLHPQSTRTEQPPERAPRSAAETTLQRISDTAKRSASSNLERNSRLESEPEEPQMPKKSFARFLPFSRSGKPVTRPLSRLDDSVATPQGTLPSTASPDMSQPALPEQVPGRKPPAALAMLKGILDTSKPPGSSSRENPDKGKQKAPEIQKIWGRGSSYSALSEVRSSQAGR
jgi:hypothetical protein